MNFGGDGRVSDGLKVFKNIFGLFLDYDFFKDFLDASLLDDFITD